MSNILANIRAKLQSLRYGYDVQAFDLSELRQQDNSADGANGICSIDSHGKVTRTQAPPSFEEYPYYERSGTITIDAWNGANVRRLVYQAREVQESDTQLQFPYDSRVIEVVHDGKSELMSRGAFDRLYPDLVFLPEQMYHVRVIPKITDFGKEEKKTEENTMSKITVSKAMASLLEETKNWPDFKERLATRTPAFKDAIQDEIEDLYMSMEGYCDSNEIKRWVYLNLMKHGYTIKKAKKFHVIVAEGVRNSNNTWWQYTYAWFNGDGELTISFCDATSSIIEVSEDDYKKLPAHFKVLAKEVK